MPHDRVRIQVTQADLARAVREDSFNCVVAEAVHRTLPKATRVEVDVQTVRWTSHDNATDLPVRHIYLTPPRVQDYVVAFDAGEPIEVPFVFHLDERKRIRVQRQVLTEAGRAITNARKVAISARARAQRTAVAAQEHKATRVQVRDAERAAVEAEKTFAQVQTEHRGAVQLKRDGDGRASGPPLVRSKTKARAYGRRVMRVNQPRGSSPLDQQVARRPPARSQLPGARG